MVGSSGKVQKTSNKHSALASPDVVRLWLREYTYRFAANLVRLVPDFFEDAPHKRLPEAPGHRSGCRAVQVPQQTVLELFKQAAFDDLWDDSSDIRDVLVYARGSKRLCIPSGWRDALPSEL